MRKLVVTKAHSGLLIGTGLLAITAEAVFAQDYDIEQVVVSASRIAIAGHSQPTPVTVVGTVQLEQDAYANIEDLIRNLPQVTAPLSSYSANQGSIAGGITGANYGNLRDLGLSRTLVLFDSQRVVGSGRDGGVGVTAFHTALISRVDIVTGGASASWGSDAVGRESTSSSTRTSGFSALTTTG